MQASPEAAIRERIALGYSRTQIIAELQAAGYPLDTAAALYDRVHGVATTAPPIPPPPISSVPPPPTSATTPVPPIPSPAAPVSPTPLSTPQLLSGAATEESRSDTRSLSTPQQHTFAPGLLIAVVVLLLIGGVAYGMVATGFSLSSLFGGPPYETETEMVEGLIRSSQSVTAHGLNIEYQFAIEERAAETMVFDTNALPAEVRDELIDNVTQMIEGGVIPAEMDIRAAISGLVDIRDEARPEFDLSINFNMLAEPLIINAAGSVRMADGVMYGKIDDFPANFEMYLEDIPMDTWLIIASEGDFELPINPILPIDSKQVLEHISPEALAFITTELQRVAALPVTAALRSQEFFSDQAAQVGASRFFDATMSDEERQLIDLSVALLKQYPPVVFVGEPKRVTFNGENVYQYELDIDFDNLRTYLTKLISEGEVITGETPDITETDLRAAFGAAEPLFEEFNRLTDIRYSFRSDGSVAGVYVGSVFTFDHADVDRQFRFEMDSSTTRHNDAMDITEPEHVHEKTLNQIMEERMEKMFEEYGYYEDDWYSEGFEDEWYYEEYDELSSPNSGAYPDVPTGGVGMEAWPVVTDSEVRESLELVRNQAEIIQAGASTAGYSTVCNDTQVQRILRTLSQSYDMPKEIFIDSNSSGTYIMCNDNQSGFAVSAPLVGSDKIWCVDSLGSSRDFNQYAVRYQSVTCGI